MPVSFYKKRALDLVREGSSHEDQTQEPLLLSAHDDYARHHSIEHSSSSDRHDDYTENDVSAVDRDYDYELEQYEMDDRIGDMPPTFTRRARREGLYTGSLTRSLRADSWVTNELLSPNLGRKVSFNINWNTLIKPLIIKFYFLDRSRRRIQ